MARIKHLALFSPKPDELAEFYRDVFGLKITGKGSYGDVWVTDGYIDFAILPHKEGNLKYPQGLNHFGFTIEQDEKDLIYKALAERGITVRPPPNDGIVRPYAEDQIKDPEGNHVDIATSPMKPGEAGVPVAKRTEWEDA